MSDLPLVSVVVPAYDAEAYVEACLRSILDQTDPRLEVIVMDDASTDDTVDVAKAVSDRIRVVRQPENLGIYENANVGIRMARGDLVAVYHADDVYEPAIVEREVEAFLERPEVGAVFCLDTFIDAEGRAYDRLDPPDDVPLDRPMSYREVLENLLLHQNPFLRCPSAMVRAEVHERVGLYEQDRWKNTSDVDMWLRIARERPIMVLGDHLFRYRHFHGSSAQRYHHLRTEPNRFFEIMDHHLDGGARELASQDALDAFEAHRSEDMLFVAVARYIEGDVEAARRALSGLALVDFWATENVQRLRLSTLLLGMRLLCRLPRIGPVADRFYGRWYARPSPADA